MPMYGSVNCAHFGFRDVLGLTESQLSASPYAMVEVIPDDVDDDDRESRLRAVETQMMEHTKRPETSH